MAFNVCPLDTYLFIYLGFNVALNTVQVISQRVVYGQRKPVHTAGQSSVL